MQFPTTASLKWRGRICDYEFHGARYLWVQALRLVSTIQQLIGLSVEYVVLGSTFTTPSFSHFKLLPPSNHHFYLATL